MQTFIFKWQEFNPKDNKTWPRGPYGTKFLCEYKDSSGKKIQSNEEFGKNIDGSFEWWCSKPGIKFQQPFITSEYRLSLGKKYTALTTQRSIYTELRKELCESLKSIRNDAIFDFSSENKFLPIGHKLFAKGKFGTIGIEIDIADNSSSLSGTKQVEVRRLQKVSEIDSCLRTLKQRCYRIDKEITEVLKTIDSYRGYPDMKSEEQLLKERIKRIIDMNAIDESVDGVMELLKELGLKDADL